MQEQVVRNIYENLMVMQQGVPWICLHLACFRQENVL